MNKHKRTYLILSVILLLGTFFTLGFSNTTNNADSDLINQPSHRVKPGFNGGVGWVVGDSVDGYGTILHTTDGGEHWVRQGTPGEIPDVSLSSVSAIDACNAWVVGSKSDGFGVILRTEDGGRSWTRQGATTQIPDFGTSAVYAANKRIAWVVGFGGLILHTKDGGRTWTRQAKDLADHYFLQGVYASDASHVWVVGALMDGYTGNPGIILHSKNSGKTWKPVTYVPNPDARTGYLITVHGLNAKTVWVVGDGTVQHTADGGETWQEQEIPGVRFYDYNGVFAVNKNTVWVSRDADGIFKYDGTQWYSQTSPKLGYYNLRISALNSQTAWLAGTIRPGGEPRDKGIIYHTTTGGDIWEAQDPVTDTGLWGISFVKSGFCNPNR
jgi:photosystem II stability/assembly factor-like uncharacterized protein